MLRQSPQCEGTHKDRWLFTTTLAPTVLLDALYSPSFSLKIDVGQYGSIHRPFSAEVVQEQRICLNVEIIGITVIQFQQLKHTIGLPHIHSSSSPPHHGAMVKKPDLNFHVKVSQNDGVIHFEDLDGPGSKYGFTQLPCKIDNDPDGSKLVTVLSAAAHFYYNLQRRPLRTSLSQDIGLELNELEDQSMQWASGDRDKLVPCRTLNMKDRLIEVVVDKDKHKHHGVEIKNSSQYDLHCSLFYFENSSMRICECLYLTRSTVKTI